MEARKLLKINQETCLKCGGCISVYPETFEFDMSGEVQVKEKAEIDPKDIPQMKSVCPVAAIIDA